MCDPEADNAYSTIAVGAISPTRGGRRLWGDEVNQVQFRRARSPEQKQVRLVAILDAAATLFRMTPVAEISLAAIADQAGLAKGSIYRYFSTKEEVLLAVLGRELSGWFEEVNARLKALEGQGDPDAVASSLVESLQTRPLMTELLARLNNVLEHNLSFETGRTFKEVTHQQLEQTGRLLEQALPTLAPGDGLHFFLWLQALVTGLWPQAYPVPAMSAVLELPFAAPLRIQFLPEFDRMARLLLRGLCTSRN